MFLCCFAFVPVPVPLCWSLVLLCDKEWAPPDAANDNDNANDYANDNDIANANDNDNTDNSGNANIQ